MRSVFSIQAFVSMNYTYRRRRRCVLSSGGSGNGDGNGNNGGPVLDSNQSYVLALGSIPAYDDSNDDDGNGANSESSSVTPYPTTAISDNIQVSFNLLYYILYTYLVIKK